MELMMLGDRILVKVDKPTEKTKGGILLPEVAKEKSKRGEVIKVGNGKRLDDGTRYPMTVKEGDIILFDKYAGMELKLGEEEYLIISEEHVIAIENK